MTCYDSVFEQFNYKLTTFLKHLMEIQAMKLATCTVSYEGYHCVKGTEKRLEFLQKAIMELKKQSIGLACFPGGYLSVKSRNHLCRLANIVDEISKDSGISIGVGIDRLGKDIDNYWDEAIRKEGFPFFAVCSDTQSDSPHIWNQRSTTSKNQHFVSDDSCSKPRSLNTLGGRIEILICGEIFNERIRKSIVNRKIRAVVDLGHESRGFRVHAAMKVLANRGIASFCSVHTKRQNAQKFCYIPNHNDWLCKSTRCYDTIIGKEPRLEIKFWNLN